MSFRGNIVNNVASIIIISYWLIPTLIEAQDAAYARSLAVDEVSSSQRRAELEANARAWDAHYRLFNIDFFLPWISSIINWFMSRVLHAYAIFEFLYAFIILSAPFRKNSWFWKEDITCILIIAYF
jgi:hypothetical protein